MRLCNLLEFVIKYNFKYPEGMREIVWKLTFRRIQENIFLHIITLFILIYHLIHKKII